MIIIKLYNTLQTFVTELNHEQIKALDIDKLGASYPDYDETKNITCWIAEYSALQQISNYCKDNDFYFKQLEQTT